MVSTKETIEQLWVDLIWTKVQLTRFIFPPYGRISSIQTP